MANMKPASRSDLAAPRIASIVLFELETELKRRPSDGSKGRSVQSKLLLTNLGVERGRRFTRVEFNIGLADGEDEFQYEVRANYGMMLEHPSKDQDEVAHLAKRAAEVHVWPLLSSLYALLLQQMKLPGMGLPLFVEDLDWEIEYAMDVTEQK